MEKKNFEMPNAEIVIFDAEDVITTSGELGGFSGLPDDF